MLVSVHQRYGSSFFFFLSFFYVIIYCKRVEVVDDGWWWRPIGRGSRCNRLLYTHIHRHNKLHITRYHADFFFFFFFPPFFSFSYKKKKMLRNANGKRYTCWSLLSLSISFEFTFLWALLWPRCENGAMQPNRPAINNSITISPSKTMKLD